jgi:hypothetical protein
MFVDHQSTTVLGFERGVGGVGDVGILGADFGQSSPVCLLHHLLGFLRSAALWLCSDWKLIWLGIGCRQRADVGGVLCVKK